MKKIYFSGKFNRLKDKALTLDQSLAQDYRAKILNDAKLLSVYHKDLNVDNRFIYAGPFYCEQVSSGEYTSTDCNSVLNAEFNAVKNSDIFFAVFDQNFSVGTIVELEWALSFNKEIVILYQEETSSYQIKSEYWFAIADALRQATKIKIYSFHTNQDMLSLSQVILEEITHEI